MKNFTGPTSLIVSLFALCVLASTGWGATLAERRDEVTRASLAYADEFYFGPMAQTPGVTVIPDVTALTPGYVVAALRTGQDLPRAAGFLTDMLAAQDGEHKSKTYGLFAPQSYESAPSLEATCRLLPLLAWIVQHGQALPPDLLQRARAALELAYAAVKPAQLPPDQPYLPLLRAAALATAGPALGHPEGISLAQSAVRDWLGRELSRGCFGGHSPSGEALQLGALDWVAAAGPSFPELDQSFRLAYADLLQRLQPGSEAVAGAASFVEPADYIEGGELHRYLLYLCGVGATPTVIRPSSMYFAACDHASVDLAASLSAPAPPRVLYTLGKEQNPKQPTAISRTDTYVADLFSLGTMSGPLPPQSVPLMITLADSLLRPTAYFFANSGPARVTSIQYDNLAAVSVNFLAAGTGNAPQAFLEGLLGPRHEIERVLISGEAWPGEPAAVAQGSVVAVERDGVYLGFRIMQSGAALPSLRVEGAKPGVLQWRGEGPEAELEFTIYARKQTYPLRLPEQYLLAGVLAYVEPTSAYASLEEFSRALLRGKLRQTVAYSKELIRPRESPEQELLHPTEPKTRSQYTVIPHLYHDLTFQSDKLSLHLQEDLVSGQIQVEAAQGAPLPAAGPWQSPLLALPWDVRQARASLTVGPH